MMHLIRIGNSLGVRIPKAVITQVGFHEKMELMLTVTDNGLLISPSKSPREGWAKAFGSSSKKQKEPLLMGDNISNQFDEEWEW